MKPQEESPLLALILKAFAVLSGILALWRYAKAMLATGADDPMVAQALASANWSAAIGLTAGGLALWWAATVIELLAKIAAKR